MAEPEYLVVSPGIGRWKYADLSSRGFSPPHLTVVHENERLYIPEGTWINHGETAWPRRVVNILFLKLPPNSSNYVFRVAVIAARGQEFFLLGRGCIDLPISQFRESRRIDSGMVTTVEASVSLQIENGQWIEFGTIDFTFGVRYESEVAVMRSAHQQSWNEMSATARASIAMSDTHIQPASATMSAVSPPVGAGAAPQRSRPPSHAPQQRIEVPQQAPQIPVLDPAAAEAVMEQLDGLREELAAKDRLIEEIRKDVALLRAENAVDTLASTDGALAILDNPPVTLVHFSDFEERVKQLRSQEKVLRDALAIAQRRREQLKAASMLPLAHRKRVVEAMELHRAALSRLDEAASATKRVFTSQYAADQHKGMQFRQFAEQFARDVAAEVADQVLTTVAMKQAEQAQQSAHADSLVLPQIAASGGAGRGGAVGQGGGWSGDLAHQLLVENRGSSH